MVIFTFGFYLGVLSHVIRLHLEMHTQYRMFYYALEFDEALNGFRLMIELCKVQLFIGVGSCVHDSWFFDSSTYFIRQERNNLPPEYQDLETSSIEELEE